jgi:4-alpha-glucanotransferase
MARDTRPQEAPCAAVRSNNTIPMAVEAITAATILNRRRAGVLLHPTSLPGPQSHGIIGHDAFRFIEFLGHAGMTIWQTLPLGPTHSDGSPYQALSAHACDPALISLDWLKDRKLVHEVPASPSPAEQRATLQSAYRRFTQSDERARFENFCAQHAYWLDDYSLFMTVRGSHQDQAWMTWDRPLRDRQPTAVETFRRSHQEKIEFEKFLQFVIFTQWQQLKRYAHEHGVLLFGDLPIYVALDSADVWANRELFLLDKQGWPTSVAGVPPDYFSETGQRWGNPLYHWPIMRQQSFHWWQQRMRTQYELFDLVRIDHFRGLVAYWEIPAEEETAINGRWREAPGEALLTALRKAHGDLPLVAEDLGTITEDVHALRKLFDIPGMKILQFAFDGAPNNLYLPHNHEANCLVYTGTHDNDTTLSWFKQLDKGTRSYISDYFGLPRCNMPWTLNRAALASVANLAILPMQDILGLGKGHRMNMPGTSEGNWQWRFEWQQVNDTLAQDLRQLNRIYGRFRGDHG